MAVLIYLIPVALLLGLAGLVAFLWALRTGQFEDLEGAGWRAIQSDDRPLVEPARTPHHRQAQG